MMKTCQTYETPACCCMDVGTVLDNTDCKASYSQLFASEQAAAAQLAVLTAKAREVESTPCEIHSQITQSGQGVHLAADFVFSCQAEAMIFQLGLR